MSGRTAIPGILAAALLAGACGESVGPAAERDGPGAPLFSFSANGIQFTRGGGSLRASGRTLVKGFDLGNPRLGDAIIVTVYWVNSTAVVDSVVDFIANSSLTRVGNKYHPVEYVTGGGYSMATFIATNVQNFPDASTTFGQILAVRAYLSDSVPDGGLKMSAFSGVEDNFATALGENGSATASDTGSRFGRAGPITLGAGALAYTVTMSGLFGMDGPQSGQPPYRSVGQGSDEFIKEEAAYRVFPSGGTGVDPAWAWYFGDQRGTWLVTTLALNPGVGGSANLPPVAAFSPSCTGLTCSFTSTSSDPDGSIAAYSWDFGDGGTSTAQNPSYTYALGGTYPVTLTVTDDRGATKVASQNVTVTQPNRPPTVDAGPDQKVVTGLLYRLDATFGDPDNDGPWSYSIDWGDGSSTTGRVSNQGTISAGHTYVVLLLRTFTVRVTVTDSHGDSGSDTKVVTVLVL
jgi:hypothetical protein